MKALSQVVLSRIVALFNIFAEETKTTYGSVCDIIIIINTRELKQRRRRRQRERQNNNFAPASRSLSFFAHFLAVVALLQRESA